MHYTSNILANVLHHKAENINDFEDCTEQLNVLVRQVYDLLDCSSHETWYFSSYASNRVKDMLYEVWKEKYPNTYPVYSTNVRSLETFLRNHHLKATFYPYQTMSWQLNGVLPSAPQHKSWTTILNQFIQRTPEKILQMDKLKY
eukprot:UN24320